MEPGKFYHAYNRGVNKNAIFFEENNYQYFLERVGFYLDPIIDLYSYCLMPNHYHLLYKVKDQISNPIEINKAFKNFLICYVKSINLRYARCGTLFQGRFKYKVVDSDYYFSTLVPYIHLNPVEAGLCKYPEDWKYSSYRSIVSDKPTKLKREEVIDWFGNKERFMKAHNKQDLDKAVLRKYIN